MKTHTLITLMSLSLLTPSLFGQAGKPTVSEEARKHFVAGTDLAKEAKTAADLSRVVSEFKQAVELAPQLPQARYNLARAREAAGDYSGAIGDLKRYQGFKLSASEARMIQDKIYELEGKKKKQVDEQKGAVADLQNKHDFQSKIGFLEGRWNARIIVYYDRLGAPSGTRFDKSDFHAIITIKHDHVEIDVFNNAGPLDQKLDGKANGSDLNSIAWSSLPSGRAAEVAITPNHQNIRIYITQQSLQGALVPHGTEIRLSRS